MKNSILLLVVFLLFGGSSIAQKKTLAQIRKERMSKAKEKKLYAEEVNPAFKVTKGPKKWEDQSAVLLAYEHTFKSNRRRIGETGPAIGGLVFEEIIRKRVLLQDSRAVAMFSQIYFSQSNGDRYIHVIKPDGKEIWVDMTKAIKVVTNVPVYYQTSSKSTTIRYSKVAIPNLEIGDIVDYRYGAVVMFSARTDGCTFPVIDFDLVDDFPIVYSKTIFDLDKETYLTTKSLNGAGEVQELDTPDGNKHFYLLNNDVEAADGERWDFPIVEHPMLRFQLIFTEKKSDYNHKASFLPENKMSLRTDISYLEITNRLDTYLQFDFPSEEIIAYAGHVIRLMKRFNPSVSEREYIRKSYYMIRQKAYHSVSSYDSKFHNILSQYKRAAPPVNNGISDHTFVSAWVIIAKKNGWDYRIGLGVPRYLGGIESVLTLEDFVPFIVINNQKIFNCTKSSVLDNVPADLAGSETIMLGIGVPNKGSGINLGGNYRKQNYKFSRDQIQDLTSELNSYNQFYNLTLNLNDQTVSMKDSVVSTGKCKSYFQHSVYYGVDLWTKEHLLTGVKKRKKRKKSNKSSKTIEKERVKEGVEKADAETKLKYIKNMLEYDNLKVASVEDFTLIQAGRSTTSPERIFIMDATINELISKVGPNYLFNIGKVIGDQVIIKDHEKDRVNGVYLSYAKAYSYSIKFTVPKGYVVAGLKKLEQSIDNPVASLNIKVQSSGNQVEIIIEHKYKEKEFLKNYWPNMIQVLKAVESFYDSKVIFKRG